MTEEEYRDDNYEAETLSEGEEEEVPDIHLFSGDATSLKRMSKNALKTGELLSNIFDAADEDQHNLLMHGEVDALLDATLREFGLKAWDIKLLMKEAEEDEHGNIAYQPLVRLAPELIEALAQRRGAFMERWKEYIEANPDSVDVHGDLHIVGLEQCEVCYGSIL